MQFPTVIGGVDIIVNMPGIKPDQLKLTGPIAGRHLSRQDHQVERSGDREAQSGREAAVAGDRAGVSRGRFGHDVRVHRLSVDAEPGVEVEGRRLDTSVKWPVGAGAKGSDGVAATVQHIRGGIGYVESAYATQNHLITAQLQNKAGKFVAADDGGVHGRRGQRRLGEGAELRGRPERPARRRELADRDRPPSCCCRRIRRIRRRAPR